MQAKETELTQLLARANLTQTELSRILGISTVSISKWNKNGVPQYAVAYLKLHAKYNNLLDKL